MIPRLVLVWLLLALGLPTRAQQTGADGPVKMTPELCFAFPLLQLNKHDVSVKYPVMINPVTVLKPGMVLRVIYQPPIQTESNDLMGAHKGTMEESYSRETANTAEHENALPQDMQHQIDLERKRVWEVTNNFVLAMAQLPTDTMHLVYSATGSNLISKLSDTSFSFFDGMMVGSPNNDVEVIGVEKGSYADQAGVKPGDTITGVGHIPIGSDLNAFAATFASVKKTAHDDQASSFPVMIRSSGTTHAVAMPLTPSIKSFLNGGL